MRITAARVMLFAIDLIVAMAAVGGGIALVAGIFTFPKEWLAGTLFRDYTTPGLVLLLAVGGSATLATLATLSSPTAGATISAGAGAILMGWVIGEVVILALNSWLEAVAFAAGLMMIVFAQAVGQQVRRGGALSRDGRLTRR